jgi:serine/threonine-protein kinase
MLTPGLRIGGYEIVRRASIGATSEVFQGRDISSGQPVAVKVLHEAFCLDADAIARFLNEARMLASFQHRRIVTLFASGSLPAGPPFMVLEWLPEQLHLALARAGGRLGTPAAARAASQIGEALLSLHDHGIIHRT